MANAVDGTVNPDGQQPSGQTTDNVPNTQTDANRGDNRGVDGVNGGQSAARKFEYSEDRSDWTPRHRLNEESGKRTRAEQERDALKGQLEAEQRRTRALAGVETPSNEQVEEAEVRERFYKMFPHMKSFENITPEQLQDVLDAAASARTTTETTWARHTAEVFSTLESEVAEGLGVDALTPKQKERLQNAYRQEVAKAVAARERAYKAGDTGYDASSDALAQFERGDKESIQAFAKDYLGDWLEPAKRSVSRATLQRQRPVPRGERSRAQVTQGVPEIDYNNEDAFKKALIDARRGGA